jgi:hypothetical protein
MIPHALACLLTKAITIEEPGVRVSAELVLIYAWRVRGVGDVGFGRMSFQVFGLDIKS